MGADTHGEPFYKNRPKQQNETNQTVMSNEQLKSEIQAWVNGADRYQQNMQSHLDYAANEIMKAVEKYAEIKAKDAWDRACEAQKQFCTIAFNNGFIPNQAPKPEYKP